MKDFIDAIIFFESGFKWFDIEIVMDQGTNPVVQHY